MTENQCFPYLAAIYSRGTEIFEKPRRISK